MFINYNKLTYRTIVKVAEEGVEVELNMKYQTPLGKTINRSSKLLFPPFTSPNQSKLLAESQLLKDQNSDLQQDLHLLNLHSNSLSIQISNLQQEISSLVNQLSVKDLIISSLSCQISEKDLIISLQLPNKILEKDLIISKLNNQISEKNLIMQSLLDNIKEKEEEIRRSKKELDQEKEEKDTHVRQLNFTELNLKEKDKVLKSKAIPSLFPSSLSFPYHLFSPQFSHLPQFKFLLPSEREKIIHNEENYDLFCEEKEETKITEIISISPPLLQSPLLSIPLSDPSIILTSEDHFNNLINDFNQTELNDHTVLNQNNKEVNFEREVEKIIKKRFSDTFDLDYKVKWKDQKEESWERAEDLLPFHSSLVTMFENAIEKENGNPSFHTILATRTNLTTGKEEFKVKWYNSSRPPSWVPSHLLLISPSLISPSLPHHDFDEEDINQPISSYFPSPFKKKRIKAIRNRMGEKEFEVKWNIIRYFKPYGPADWSIFLSADPAHFASCNTIHHSTLFLRSILPPDSLLYSIKKEEVKGKGFRPPHLMCRSDHSSIQYECVIGFEEGRLVVELEKGRKRMGCRMWRKWGSHRFLYVSFRHNVPAHVISTVCEEGLTLHPLSFSYHFLFSKPMERQIIFFMENGFPHIPAHTIREWAIEVGRNAEMNVCKYNARLSLSFSPSIPVSVIPFEDTAVIEDEYGREGDEGSIMTDGCSFISLSSLLTFKTQARLTHTPSVVQGRYANSKGVWIMGDSNRMGSSPLLRRRSQIKYNLPTTLSDDHLQTFDLLHYSREMGAARLNRQYIQVLEYLGIPSQTFLDLQHDAISQLLLSLTSSPEMALKEVKGGKEGEGIEIEVKEFLLAGFDFKEPYIRNSLLSLLMHRLKKIKEKASIKVEMSRYLLMVPDPTGILKEGEVFIQISGEGNGLKVINSSVIVTRTPCHLPSDVRVMSGVDIVELRNMVDCVVFSTHGSSSPASMMSGGDYDGDLAWVCWDPRLLSFPLSPPPPPLPISSDPAINVDPASLIRVGDAVGWGSSNYINVPRLEKHLIDHFLLHSKSKLGELTIIHSRWAEGEGLDHPTTIRLAQLCALAVDSAKSGVVITLPSLSDTPPWPHYLKSSSHFHSTSALGKLYDDIQPEGIINRVGKWWKDKKKSGPSSPLLLDPDLLLSTIPPRYLSLADGWMKDYNKEMSQIMKKFSDPVIKKLKCEQLQEIMREKYLSACSSIPESLLLASAIYKVTRSRDIDLKQAARNFPWMICADRLIRLKCDAVNKRLDNHLAPTILSRFYSSVRFD